MNEVVKTLRLLKKEAASSVDYSLLDKRLLYYATTGKLYFICPNENLIEIPLGENSQGALSIKDGPQNCNKVGDCYVDDNHLYILTNAFPRTFSSLTGEKGDKGDNGANGKSAYEIAKKYTDYPSEQDWLASLVGSSGDNGKSAYEVAKNNGYTGTEAEWLESLKGNNGLSAYEIANKNHLYGSEGAWLESLKLKFSDLTEEEKASLKGEPGKGFSIAKTYPSILDMMSHVNDVALGDFVLIDAPVTDEHNSELYVRTENSFKFINDLSGLTPTISMDAEGNIYALYGSGTPKKIGTAQKGSTITYYTTNVKTSEAECTQVGDCFIDTNGNLKVRLESGSFTPIANLKGSKGDTGADGKGITSITPHYLATTSSTGVSSSTTGWSTSILAISSSKPYLWLYETISYTTGNPTNTTPHIIGHFGVNGTNGTMWTTGTTNPSGTAVSGDLYLNTSNGDIWKYTTSWNKLSTLLITCQCTDTIENLKLTVNELKAEIEALKGNVLHSVSVYLDKSELKAGLFSCTALDTTFDLNTAQAISSSKWISQSDEKIILIDNFVGGDYLSKYEIINRVSNEVLYSGKPLESFVIDNPKADAEYTLKVYGTEAITVTVDGKSVTPKTTERVNGTMRVTLELITPTKTGYSFDGWYISGTETKVTNFTFTESVALESRFSINSYEVTLNAGTGGSVTMHKAGDTSIKYTESIPYNTNVVLVPNASDGYSFKGFTSSDVTISNNTFVMPAKNVTITATFEKNVEPQANFVYKGISRYNPTSANFDPTAPVEATDTVERLTIANTPQDVTLEGTGKCWFIAIPSDVLLTTSDWNNGGLTMTPTKATVTKDSKEYTVYYTKSAVSTTTKYTLSII